MASSVIDDITGIEVPSVIDEAFLNPKDLVLLESLCGLGVHRGLSLVLRRCHGLFQGLLAPPKSRAFCLLNRGMFEEVSELVTNPSPLWSGGLGHISEENHRRCDVLAGTVEDRDWFLIDLVLDVLCSSSCYPGVAPFRPFLLEDSLELP